MLSLHSSAEADDWSVRLRNAVNSPRKIESGRLSSSPNTPRRRLGTIVSEKQIGVVLRGLRYSLQTGPRVRTQHRLAAPFEVPHRDLYLYPAAGAEPIYDYSAIPTSASGLKTEVLLRLLHNEAVPAIGAKAEPPRDQEKPAERPEASPANKPDINHTYQVHQSHRRPPLRDFEDDPYMAEIADLQTKMLNFTLVSHGSHNHTMRDWNPLIVAPSSYMQRDPALSLSLFTGVEECVTERRTMNRRMLRDNAHTPFTPACPDNRALQEYHSEAEEMENYRSAMSKMAEDIIALRTRVVTLEAENSRLHTDLSLQQDYGPDPLEDAHIDVMTKAEVVDRFVSLKFKLASETSKAAAQRDRIQRLQNDLIKKNDSEKQLMQLQRVHQNLQRHRSHRAETTTLEVTVKQQEKVNDNVSPLL
ncbi:Coiled-coil domain-containing protein 33 [Liparis tanakae]|uniref:Coiled-coil domain-containing protein 33 n=1 Tax=Liparis tanakae TaxID=230148 RepID=A0A4Z2JAR5_9TELE|nr:Coiled-coil domain-containing protein 33 [Liparis tanakae]